MNPFRFGKSDPKSSPWGAPQLRDLLRKESVSGEEGARQLGLSNFSEAEKHLVEAALEAERRSTHWKAHVHVLLNLAEAQRRQGKFAEARGTIETAMGLLPDGGAKSNAEKAHCYELLGSVCMDEADYPGAQQALSESIRVEESLWRPDRAALSSRLTRLGQANRHSRDFDGAREALAKALQLTERSFGTNSSAAAEVLLEQAALHQDEGSFEKGLQCVERALEIHQATYGNDSEEVARDFQQMAALYHAVGDLEKSVAYYERALYIRERRVGGSDLEQALVKMNLADVYVSWGRHAAALDLMQQAVLRLECVHDGRLPQALENMGMLYARCGRYQEAASCLTRAREEWEQATGDHSTELEANQQVLAQIVSFLPPEDAAGIIPAESRPCFLPDQLGLPAQMAESAAVPVMPPGRQGAWIPSGAMQTASYAVVKGAAPDAAAAVQGIPFAAGAAAPVISAVPLMPAVPAGLAAPVQREGTAVQAAVASAALAARGLDGWDELSFDILRPA